jgi:DNA-binding NarL/FixJ family response regulator
MTRTFVPERGAASHELPAHSLRRLLVLDDYVTFADALATRLSAEPGMRALAATSIKQARRALLQDHFDALLLDLDLDGHNGLRFAAETLAAQPNLRIVVMTGATDVRQVIDAVQIGISGWVPKEEPIEYLLKVVRGALRDETWIPPPLLTGVIAALKTARRDGTERDRLLAKLTRREKEILSMLVMGMRPEEIASQLCLSRNTVRTHIQRLMVKLNVHSAVQAAAVARQIAAQERSWPRPGASDRVDEAGASVRSLGTRRSEHSSYARLQVRS